MILDIDPSHRVERGAINPRRDTMKKFRCGDVVPGCTHIFAGSEDDILAQVSSHARTDHGIAEIPTALVDQVRAVMTPAAA